MQIKDLTDNWELRRLDHKTDYHQPQIQHLSWIPATVPGHVHGDLVTAGVIADPFGRSHEVGVQWIDEARWGYRCSFDWAPRAGCPRRLLRFEGLDTIATVCLNGKEIGRSDNMFEALEIDVTEGLVDGKNELTIDFDSALEVGRERRRAYFEAEGLDWKTFWFDERSFVRKAGYMYGWDWGPRLVSCGVWKPVQLLEFESRIVRASFLQEQLSDGRFRVWADAVVDGPAKIGAEFGGEVRQPGENLEFFLEAPQLWWPNGEGAAHLYDARVFLDSGEEVRKKIGIRTISLVQEKDSQGQSFEFVVNGRRIWSRGANWIPNDSFLGRSTDESIHSQIDICRSLNMNMLRVWGGGVYESEAFYDACDAAGIIVWQDFPYACSYYPDGPAEQSIAAREAGVQILRLRDRASLGLWCGNNENLAMFEGAWGGIEHRPPRYYGDDLYNKALPETVQKLDPSRDYISTSPLIPMDETVSDAHYWDVWHGRGDWNFYRESKARFSSEFGFASSCSMACWDTVLGSNDYDVRSNAVRWHDKTSKGAETFEGFVLMHYPMWESLEDWVYYSQLNQRDAFRCGIEHYRSSSFCRGSLIWQFNDCWPVQSWAVQDYNRLLKPAGFELGRLYAPALLAIHIHEGEVHVHVVNDGPSALSTSLEVRSVSVADGAVLKSWTVPVNVASNDRQILWRMPVSEFEGVRTALSADLGGDEATRTWAFMAEPNEMEFGAAKVTASLSDGLVVKVSGFVGDFVVWDADDANNLRDPQTGQPGWKARTLANGEFRLDMDHAPKRLLGRTLASRGSFEIPLT